MGKKKSKNVNKVSNKDELDFIKKIVEETPKPEPEEPEQVEVTITKGNITRRLVRNSLFRLRDNRVERPEIVAAIWDLIRPQLRPGEDLSNFTFVWDVNPSSPLDVIRRAEWDQMKAEKYPDEYKKQEQVEEEITLFTGQA